jgi:3,4-dihydroxy 2-butanone 4-phosphate synthase/GTP cyclohydrolase II
MALIDEWLAGAEEHVCRRRRPLVTLSYAQSLDGSIAAARSSRTAISGPEALRLTHELRAAHDAILVGIGTVLADNPRLTVRLVPGKNPQPVVLDTSLRFPLNAELLGGEMHPWIAAAQLEAVQGTDLWAYQERCSQLEARGARLLFLPVDGSGRVSLTALLECLVGLGMRSLMVEGGASVITSFLAERLVDQVVLTLAPVFLGGIPAVEAHPADASQRPYPLGELQEMKSMRAGSDLILWGRVK